MIDDDYEYHIQQEKKMSVEGLILRQKDITFKLVKDDFQQLFKVEMFAPECWVDMVLDRNQAHMLMLYLQQHLGYVSISKDRLGDE